MGTSTDRTPAPALYTAEARVSGGRTHGRGRTPGGELDVEIRMPVELGGPGGATNPEQLFAVGYAACFQASLALVGQQRAAETADSVVDASVALLPTDSGGLRLGVELDVALPSVADPAAAADLVRAAHAVCPYSAAVRGNVEVRLRVVGRSLAD
jgi:lipoyl-dependent peroxiredoxin